ncbi:unnamed protein product [Mytilus edulis]|uniref:Uncharacterized protein n=1 Tax=Mytilus edulis TaxID=6550 RepID=A0A8S3Q3Q0_MYTED|nr:unnamed protein product [Mytilus edulis]
MTFSAYSEDDVYISNSSTTYSNIPTDCNLFGNEFEAGYPVQKININITEIGTYWIGAKIVFKRNINPLGVSCSCLKSNHVDVGLSKTKICEHPKNGLCYEHNCVVYERESETDGQTNRRDLSILYAEILCKFYKTSECCKQAYMCDVYYFESLIQDWIFTTKKCSVKLNFICDGDNPSSDAMNTSWLVAEQTCSKRTNTCYRKQKYLEMNSKMELSGDTDVCAAITIFPNGSVSLVSRFCTDQLATLCHIHTLHRDHQNTTANDDSSPLGLIVGCCVGVLAVIAMVILFIIFKRRNVKKRKLRYLESVIKDHDTEYTEYDNPMEDNSDHMYKSTDVTKPSYSDYSLAVTYSDPINSVLPKNIKSIPETEYESIAMTPPKTKQIYPVENPYQSPYS